MSTDGDSKPRPKSLRHKQILEAAETNPSASIDDLASEVPSATPDLVEHVLEEHGDPGIEQQSSPESSETAPMTDGAMDQDGTMASASGEAVNESVNSNAQESTNETEGQGEADHASSIALDDLSENQRDLVKAIAADPKATQKELADRFDVTRATISRWANDITGFDWSERKSFIESLDGEFTTFTGSTNGESTDESVPTNESRRPSPDLRTAEYTDEMFAEFENIKNELDQFDERIEKLEGALESASSQDNSVFDDPNLVHKVAHACLDSENITESEELEILEGLLE